MTWQAAIIPSGEETPGSKGVFIDLMAGGFIMIRFKTNMDNLIKCIDSWVTVHELPELNSKRAGERAAWWYDNCFITAIEQSKDVVLMQFRQVPPGVKSDEVNEKVLKLLRMTFEEVYTSGDIRARNTLINIFGRDDYHPEFATVQKPLPQTIDEALREFFGNDTPPKLGRPTNDVPLSLPPKPDKPAQGQKAPLDEWFRYYHACKEANYKITLNEIAVESGYSHHTIKKRHSTTCPVCVK